MRIGKLAQELGLEAGALIRLLHQSGQKRYRDPAQQLPADVEALVRRRAAALPRAAPLRPVADAGPVRNLDRVPLHPADPADEAALLRSLSGVRPLDPAPPSPRAAPGAPRPAGLAGRERRAAPASEPPEGPLPPSPAVAARPTAEALQLSALLSSLARAESEIAGWRARVGALEAERDALAARLREADVQRDALRLALLEAEHGAPAEPKPLEPVPAAEAPPRPAETLRTVLERRGLRGESELAAALEVLAGAPRLRELLDHVPVAAADGVVDWFEERFVLVGPDEVAPPGVLALPVAPTRSELPGSPVLRPLFTRLATALLVNGIRRIYVAGGSPAGRRTLRDGLDDRVELRFVERGPQPLPPASLAVRWGGQAQAGELPVDGRGVPELVQALLAAAER